jgi:putative FmdB family regulatory protein
MPLYEYRCRTCDERFEVRRSMHDTSADAPCPNGHDDTVRLLSMFATTGITASRQPAPVGAPAGGGCCGGACGCAH